MDKCIDQAERFLVLRDHNKAELRTKLKNKGFSDEEADRALEVLLKNGELNEDRYVNSFVRSNNRKHPEGKSLVFQRLLAKGADKETVIANLNALYTPDYVQSLIKAAYENFAKKETDLTKIKARLSKAGFRLSEINFFLNNME